MAVHAHEFWRSLTRNTGSHRASYLSDDGWLRFDDGHEVNLKQRRDAGLRLDLAELAALHFGVGQDAVTRGDEHQDARRSGAAERIAERVRAHGFEAYTRLLPPLYGDGVITVGGADVHASHHAANPKNFSGQGSFTRWDLTDLVGALKIPAGCADATPPTIDTICRYFRQGAFTGKKKSQMRKGDATWLWGDWLEVWLAGALASLTEKQGTDKLLFDAVHQDVVVEKQATGERFQADVVAIRGFRVFLFSCTTDSQPPMVKHKIFEAMHRAARIGGEHARVGMLSFVPEPKTLLALAHADGWTGYDQARVFGLPHFLGDAASTAVDAAGTENDPQTLNDAIRNWVLQ